MHVENFGLCAKKGKLYSTIIGTALTHKAHKNPEISCFNQTGGVLFFPSAILLDISDLSISFFCIMDELPVSVPAIQRAAAEILSEDSTAVNTAVASRNESRLPSTPGTPRNNQRVAFSDADIKAKLEGLVRPTISRFNSLASVLTYHDDSETVEKYAQAPQQSWNNPRENIWKLLAAYFEYFVHGLKDSAIGVLMSSLERHYDVEYMVISLAFLAPFVGYTIAACVNDRLHRKIGRWGVCIVGIFFQLFFYVSAAAKAPFPLFVIAYGSSGIGSGLIEGGWNAWAGGLKSSPQVLGLLHGFYGIGGLVCPLVGNAMLDDGLPYNYLYIFITGCSCLSLFFLILAFRKETPARYRAQNAITNSSGEVDGKHSSAFSLAMKKKLVWFLAATIFTYAGSEVSIGGWSTTYMTKVIGEDRASAEYVDTGYWAGIAAGRIICAFVTGWVGHWELMVAVYIGISVILAIINLTVKVLAASAVSFGLLGFFLGPLFPTMMAVATKKLPKFLHVSGIGFAAALGGAGSAVLPFVAGVLVQKFGATAITPLILACLCAMFALWLIIVKFC